MRAELNSASAFSWNGKMFLFSPRLTLCQRMIVSSGVIPLTLLSRTIRRSRRLSDVEMLLFSSIEREVRADAYSLKMCESSTAEVISGFKACIPSIMSMSFSSNVIDIPESSRLPSLKLYFGILTVLPASRSLSWLLSRSRSMARRDSKS